MLGALIGDYVGSRYEFHNVRRKDFEFYTKYSRNTDDSVLTCAVADALMDCMPLEFDEKNLAILRVAAADQIVAWSKAFPDGGYGGMFRKWMHGVNGYQPYNSFGNGSAMRISAVPYFAKNIDEVKKLSKAVTAVTHNHPEGIKGAEAIAVCIFMALQNEDKEAIKKVACSYYPEIEQLDYETLVETYEFNETCQGSVPQAIYCFLISKDFEDCIRTAISIGGDSDTIGAMAGSIAEAYYGIPDYIRDTAFEMFPEKIQECYKRFEKAIQGQPESI